MKLARETLTIEVVNVLRKHGPVSAFWQNQILKLVEDWLKSLDAEANREARSNGMSSD